MSISHLSETPIQKKQNHLDNQFLNSAFVTKWGPVCLDGYIQTGQDYGAVYIKKGLPNIIFSLFLLLYL